MLEQFEPSACRCKACRQTCKSTPGICAPGDVERIAAHVGMDGEQFAFDHFNPVMGQEMTYGCETIGVPAIRPKTIDGRCVFLTPDERCSIHPVRPFGCAVCNACEGGNHAAIEQCMDAIAHDMEYLDLWTGLAYGSPVT